MDTFMDPGYVPPKKEIISAKKEYKVTSTPQKMTDAQYTQVLNDQIEAGWELIHIFESKDGFSLRFILSRPKK